MQLRWRAGTDVEDIRTGCRPVHSRNDEPHTIPDIDKIPQLPAIAENCRGFTRRKAIGKNRDHTRIGRTRVLARDVNIEKPEACCRHIVNISGNARVLFATKFVRAIGGRRAFLCIFDQGNGRIISINGSRRRIDRGNRARQIRIPCRIEHVYRPRQVNAMGQRPFLIRPLDGSNRGQVKPPIHARHRFCNDIRIRHITNNDIIHIRHVFAFAGR